MQGLSPYYSSSIFVNKPKRKFKIIPDLTIGSGSESDLGSDEEDTPVFVQEARTSVMDQMADFWIILKAMRQLRLGNQRTAVTCLTIISTFDLSTEFNMAAVTEPGSLELLINVAETNDIPCRVGALCVLKQLSRIPPIAEQLVNLGISDTLTHRLIDDAADINQYAADIIASIGWRRKASRALRKSGAIQALVSRLRLKKALLILEDFNLHFVEKEDVQTARSVAYALWAMSKFTKNKMVMLGTGILSEVTNILLSGNKSIVTPVVGVLGECSTVQMFKVSLQNEGLVGVLIHGLKSEDVELQRLCALALSRAAGGNDVVREMIRFHNGPKFIMQLITSSNKDNIPLVTAAISALWKSAVSEANVKEFERLDAVDKLMDFLTETHVEVLVVTVGAIGEMAKSKTARETFINKGAMTEIISLLGHINEELLANAAHAVGVCSDCDEGIVMLDKSDGLRLLWSLLKSSSRKVKVKALWAVKPCVARHPDSGELIRSLMGSLSLLVKMLLEQDVEVLTAVCAVISEVALDLENLAVMTEQGVVNRLAAIVSKEKRDASLVEEEEREARGREGIRSVMTLKRIQLHRELSSALANCATLTENRRKFGRAGVVPVIVGYLGTRNPELLAQACRALHVLSQDHFNCVSMQSCGAVPHLLTAIESQCKVTQIGATGTLKNIRRMLLEADQRKLVFMCLPRAERMRKLAEIDAIVRVLSGPREPEEERMAILKGIARPSLRTIAIMKAKSKKGKIKDSSIIWADAQRQHQGVMKKHSSLLSWRERMTLYSEISGEGDRDRRPSETEAIMLAKAAQLRGSKLQLGSVASQGSKASDASPPTEYATLSTEPPKADGILEPMDDGVI